MQDNPHHNKYTSDFVDTQWSNMAELLDSNLPVDTDALLSKHRQKMIWLLSTLLFISILSTAFYAYKYKSFVPSAELVKESTIYKTIYLKEEQATADEVNKVETKTTTFISTTQRQATTRESVATITEERSGTSAQFSPKQLAEPAISTLPKHNQLSALKIKQGLLENKSTIISMETSSDAKETTVEKAKKSIEYNIGLQTIVSTDLDYTGIGLQTGMLIPLSKKLGLNTGLAVNMISREQYFIDFFPRNKTNSSPLPPDLSSTETYYNGLKSLKQIYIPIGMMYAFTKNLALNSGVKLRYTYSENVDKFLPPPPSGSRAPVTDTESIFNNANLGFSAGLQYKFNPHFSILLDSEWGLSKFISSSQFQNSNAKRHDLNMINLTTNYIF